jgi:hypothetical protein
MSTDSLAAARRNLRGTDDNSLLRLYDQANDIIGKTQSQLERRRADKALLRIAKELQKRKVTH